MRRETRGDWSGLLTALPQFIKRSEKRLKGDKSNINHSRVLSLKLNRFIGFYRLPKPIVFLPIYVVKLSSSTSKVYTPNFHQNGPRSVVPRPTHLLSCTFTKPQAGRSRQFFLFFFSDSANIVSLRNFSEIYLSRLGS